MPGLNVHSQDNRCTVSSAVTVLNAAAFFGWRLDCGNGNGCASDSMLGGEEYCVGTRKWCGASLVL
jgi:hypothetical protein